MSVIMRSPEAEGGEITLFLKGADSAVVPRLADVYRTAGSAEAAVLSTTLEQLNAFSDEGLRCLLYAQRCIPKSEQAEFLALLERYSQAKGNIAQLELKGKGEPNEIDEIEELLESDLELLGCSAIEDRLQDGVPETISTLSEAGLGIWMLTGDKQETAINIGMACRLIKPPKFMQHIIISDEDAGSKDPRQLRRRLQKELNHVDRHGASNRRTQRMCAIVLNNLPPPPNASATAVEQAGGGLLRTTIIEEEGGGDGNDYANNVIGSGPTSPVSPQQPNFEVHAVYDRSSPEVRLDANPTRGHLRGSPRDCKAPQAPTTALTPSLGQLQARAAAKPVPTASAPMPRALIVDGASLLTIFEDEELKHLLLRLSLECASVVACRVSPDQKRQIVELIRNGCPIARTLAVGDGANDVAMIQGAHVGVGIKGEEGVQAVNASDFAIAQFRYLKPLILKHGRYNYIRSATLITYIFYKNTFMSIGQFWFYFLCGFSGQKLYAEVAIQGINFFTFFSILMLSIYDKDVSTKTVYKYPGLYAKGMDNELFTPVKFWISMFDAVCESVFVCFMSFALLHNYDPEQGQLSSFWEAGVLCYSVVIIVSLLKMCFLQHRWNTSHVIVLILQIGSWFLFGWVYNAAIFFNWDFFGSLTRVVSSGTFWMASLVMVAALELKNLGIASLLAVFFPDNYQILREVQFQTEAENPTHKFSQISMEPEREILEI
jgi:magnesium-transporting ATPase (P-type)